MEESDEVVVLYEYSAQLPDELNLKVGDVVTKVERMEGGWWRGDLAGKRGMFPDNFVKVLPGSSSSTNLHQTVDGDVVQLRNKKRCRVLFSYQPVHEDELELQVDQVLEFMGEVEDGWWKGRSAGRVGVFPSNFVEMCSEEKQQVSVDERNNKNIQSAKINESDKSSTKAPQQEEIITKQSPSSQKSDESRKSSGLSTSQRSQIGPDSPAPDTAPRLPPKPVKEQCLVLFPYTAQNEDELTLQEGQLISILTKECEDKGWWKGELDGKVGVFPDNFVKRVSQHLSQENLRQSLPETPEKPKFQSLKASPSRENIKKMFEQPSGPASVVSKATSFEKLKPEQAKQVEDEKRSNDLKSVNKSEFNMKVSNLKNELAKSDLFNKPKLGSATSRASMGAIVSEPEVSIADVKRRISEPVSDKKDDLDNVVATSKLDHPTASRVKAPKRRPPSQHFLKDNIPDVLEIKLEDEEACTKSTTKTEEEKERVIDTEEVSNKTKFLENSLNKPIGAIQVMPALTKPAGSSSSPDAKPSWMEEFSRKKANRKSGIFAENKQDSTEDVKSSPKVNENKPDKPTPPKADSKPSIANKPESDLAEIRKSFTRDKSQSNLAASKQESDVAEIRKSFSRDKSQTNVAAKIESPKHKVDETEVEKRPESGKTERPSRPSLPAALVSSSSSVVKSLSEVKRNSELVRHGSEATVTGVKTSAERKHSELTRKHSDSSRHSEKSEKPTVHSANLGNPEKFSFAKPERPVMDKVLTKNDKNIAKTEAVTESSDKPNQTNENTIGWRSEIISNNRVSDVLASRETNGYHGKEGYISKEKENINGPCKELIEVKKNLLDIQTEFQLQIKTLRKELEDERNARVKLEAEVRALKKLVNK